MVNSLEKKRVFQKGKIQRNIIQNLICALFAFFLCFMFEIQNIFISNIIFLLLVLLNLKGIRLKINGSALWLFLFFAWTAVSTISFAIEYRQFSIRNFIQWVFNIQYILFIIKLRLPLEKIKEYFVLFSKVLALYIIIVYIASGAAFNYSFSTLFSSGRMWGNQYVPGWPNTTVLPLLFGLYLMLNRKNKYKVMWSLVYFAATVLTTSRVGFIGCVILFIYHILSNWKRMNQGKRELLILLFLVVLFIILFLVMNNPALVYRLTVFWDRNAIAESVMEFMRIRPFMGFGGNSYDVVYELFSGGQGYNWGHTHNTVLELLIRYGTVGAVLFIGFIVLCFKQVAPKHRFMFLFLWLISLFQIYFRNFTFIFFIFMLMQDKKEVRVGTVGNYRKMG